MPSLITPTATAQPPLSPSVRSAGTPTGVDELRLALVCDGGVSLAIYEHGLARELLDVTLASRAFDRIRSAADPDAEHRLLATALTPAQSAYLGALRHPPAGAPLRSVVIDVVAGSSAGGINGVFLAKALSGNHGSEALTRLWLERASFTRLLRPSPPTAARRDPEPRDPSLPPQAPLPAAPKPIWSPFNGDEMARWVLEALEEMDASTALAPSDGERPESLLRPGQELDLFVTTTDLRGYFVRVPSVDGGDGDIDRQNRVVLHFSPSTDGSGFGPGANGGLAFAARATSCFPGAFSPVCVDHVAGALARGRTAPPLVPAPFIAKHLGQYALLGADAGTRLFVDGGVLDNRPFDVMIGAIASKSAQTRVDRRIVHIVPDPPRVEEPGTPGPRLRFLSALARALHLMKTQSTLGDLAEVQAMNAEIRRIGALTEHLHDRADERLSAFAPPAGVPFWRAARDWAPRIYDGLARDAAHETYERLKVDAIVQLVADDLATALGYPEGTQHRTMLHEALAGVGASPVSPGDSSEDAGAFLRRADLPFQARRLLFLVARVNALYPGADATGRERLDRLKGELWAQHVDLVAARVRIAGSLASSVGAFLGRQNVTAADVAHPASFAAAHGSDRDALLSAFADAAWTGWDGVARLTAFFDGEESCPQFESIIRDFLWFPVWDAAVFPVIALSQLPQLTPITLSRFGPTDARLLRTAAGSGKLRGTAVRNFGGFLSRSRRENDYVWGRLDGVELILRLLGVTAPGDVAPALRAVAQELRHAVTSPADPRPLLRTRAARRLLADVEGQLDALAGAGAAASPHGVGASGAGHTNDLAQGARSSGDGR